MRHSSLNNEKTHLDLYKVFKFLCGGVFVLWDKTHLSFELSLAKTANDDPDDDPLICFDIDCALCAFIQLSIPSI